MHDQKERATSLVQYDETNLYRRLLMGGNVAAMLSQMGWPDGVYQTYALVLTTSIDSDALTADLRIFFVARLSKYALIVIHRMDRRRILLLVQPKVQFPTQQWRTAIEILCNMILKQFAKVMLIDASGECCCSDALYAAYRRLVAPARSRSNSAIHIEEDPMSILSVGERARLMTRVTELLSDGEADSAVVLLKSAWKRNRRLSELALWELISVSVIAASPMSPWKVDNMIWECFLYTVCEPGSALAKEWLAHVRAFYDELTVRDCGSSICQVMEILHAEFSDKLQLTSIAQRLGINPVYISSQFCQVTGRRFADVITEIRIEHALKLLTQDPCLKNGQLAEEAGFSSTTYFCEAFKRCVGKTVRQYAKEVCVR